jgi:hypothetical protein
MDLAKSLPYQILGRRLEGITLAPSGQASHPDLKNGRDFVTVVARR